MGQCVGCDDHVDFTVAAMGEDTQRCSSCFLDDSYTCDSCDREVTIDQLAYRCEDMIMCQECRDEAEYTSAIQDAAWQREYWNSPEGKAELSHYE